VKSLVEMNDAVFAEFRRLTRCSDTLQFPRWWAERVREVIRLEVTEIRTQSDLHVAASRWARLTRSDQQSRLLLYLAQLQPPPTLKAVEALLRRVA
jgi:hypothetical protein